MGNHRDCNQYTEVGDTIEVANFTMVCVQNPSQALGPCTGEPQGTFNNNVYTGNWEAKSGELPFKRPVWNVEYNGNIQKIDYCIPACNALLASERENSPRFN